LVSLYHSENSIKKMLSKKYLLFTIILFFAHFSFAQIGGISASKISAFNYIPVPFETVEFEPTTNIFQSNSIFDNDGNTISLDTPSISSSLNWRITYGLTENIEVGLTFPSSMQGANTSIKAYLWGQGIFHLGAMAGLYFPWGNRNYDKNNPTSNDIGNYGLGLVGSLEWDARNSTDINIQFQNNFKDHTQLPTNSYFINADHGWYSKNGKVLWIFGSGYQYGKVNDQVQSKFTLYPGFAWEFPETFLIVIATSFDISGKNTSKNIGFGMSLTTSLK